MRGLTAADRALVHLRELVAVHGVVQEKREIREQPQVRADRIRAYTSGSCFVAPDPLGAEAVARGVPAIGWIDGAEERHAATADRPQRHLASAGPGRALAHRCEREAFLLVAKRA